MHPGSSSVLEELYSQKTTGSSTPHNWTTSEILLSSAMKMHSTIFLLFFNAFSIPLKNMLQTDMNYFNGALQNIVIKAQAQSFIKYLY